MAIKPKISVIIVNYNVREFILQSLYSIDKALKDISHEIVVIDNASIDGSIQEIQKHFPSVHMIINEKNIGFSAANNQGFKKASGDYLVLINPDTIVQEDTFSKLLKFMEKTPDAGAVSCKILNPDGSFSIDCRHSVPTPLTAFWKITGLSRLFPKSRIFGRYNLTFLDPEETNVVEAISGSFMFIRRETFNQVGYLDERFFMYCEDIDYCHRINQTGWKIYYLPTSNIIHYKGESTKKNNLDYIITFNKSLYTFYKKHFQQKYVTLFRWLILLGIFFRGLTIFFKNLISTYFPLIVDIFILNLIIILSFAFRLKEKFGMVPEDFITKHIFINLATTIIYVTMAFAFDLYSKFRFSILQVLKTNFWTFFILSALTFFLKQFAYSRLVILIAAIFSIISMALWRIGLRIRWKKNYNTYSRTLFRSRILLVGTENNIELIVKKIKNKFTTKYDLIGLISLRLNEIGKKIAGLTVIGTLSQIKEIVKIKNINQIIFTTHTIPYKTIINTMTALDNMNVEFKVIPSGLDFIIGKSSVEHLDYYSLMDIDYAMGKRFNRFLKRTFDIACSFVLLTITFPYWTLFYLIKRKKIQTIEIWDGKGDKQIIRQNNGKPFKGIFNKLILLNYVLNGKLSIVGAPIRLSSDTPPAYLYKPGLTGIVQMNQDKISNQSDQDQYELFYLKEYSFWLDLEILLKIIID
jgi:GT2 family glycosyltransferase